MAIALSISTSSLIWVPSSQAGPPLRIPPSGEAGGVRRLATEEDVDPLIDRDAPPMIRIKVVPFLRIGGDFKVEYELEKNFDLKDVRDDERSTLEPAFSLAYSFDPNEHFQAFLNLEVARKFTLEEEGKKRRTTLELSQAFIFFKDVMGGLSLQIGRQRFKDGREWLYDEKLDAVRASYRVSDLSLEISVSRRGVVDRDLLNADPKGRITNYLLYSTYALGKKVGIAAYSLLRDDRSPERKSPIFFGLQSSGEIVNGLDYWLELAHVRGWDGSRRIRGIGLDLGATYQFDLPLKPSLAVGYAFGTGDDDPNDQVDKRFRQTGLQDNSDKFHGVTRFKYYGELFDPELSNLAIFTGGIGIRPTRRSSIDLVSHYYLQDKASNGIRESEIDARPTGLSRRLGGEIDLIVGYREIRNVDIELVLGHFIPGRAFPADADSAFFARLEIRFRL